MPVHDHQPHVTCEVRRDGARVVLVVGGELDHFTAGTVRSALTQLLMAGAKELVVDLRPLRFMESGGIHVLEDLRDGRFGRVRCRMHDPVGPALRALVALGGPRVLPAA